MGSTISIQNNKIQIIKKRYNYCGCVGSRKTIYYTITKHGIKKNINNKNCLELSCIKICDF